MPDPHRKQFETGWTHLEAGRHGDAEKVFAKLLQKDPEHFLGNFGRLFLLFTQTATASAIAERSAAAKAVLRRAPKQPTDPRERFAMRYATNALANDMLNERPRRLDEGLRYATLGARYDAEYDELTPVTATQCEILIELGRDHEAYPIVHAVLRAKPTYSHFQALARSAGYKRWHSGYQAERRRAFVGIVGPELATERNCAMLAVAEQLNGNRQRAPLDRATIDRLSMQAIRGDRASSVPLPPSLRALLAYDARLEIHGHAFFADLLGASHRKKKLVSTTMTAVFKASEVASAYKDLRESAEADLPALVELPLGGDQRVFMYVAGADADAEYPILRFDDEPCIWLSSGCLQDEICMLLHHASIEPSGQVPGATKRKQAAAKRVAQWLAREPEQRFHEEDEE